MTLSLRLVGENRERDGSLTPTAYAVIGLPHNETATIAIAGDRWEILRVKGDILGQWQKARDKGTITED